MAPDTEHIDPSAKLVDEVADWLCGRELFEGLWIRRMCPQHPEAVPVPPLPTNVWLWDDEELGPCPAPIRLDRPSGPDNPWNPKEVLD